MILGYNLSQIWSSDSISVRCWFVDVSLIQGPSRLDLGWTVGSFFKGPWAWSLKVDLGGSSRSHWGLILRMSVSSRAVEAWYWITVMNGSSKAFGLDLEEQWWTDLQGLLGLILKVDLIQGPSGLDLELVDDCWSKGPLGLDLRMNDERRTKSEESVLDSSRTWILESFGVSELQSFKSFA